MNTHSELDVQGLVTLVSLGIPLLVALVAAKVASAWEKQLISVVFNAVASGLILWLNADFKVDFWTIVITVVNSIVSALAAFKVFQNTGVTDGIQKVVPGGIVLAPKAPEPAAEVAEPKKAPAKKAPAKAVHK